MKPSIEFQQVWDNDPVSVSPGIGDQKPQRRIRALDSEIHLTLVISEIEEVRVLLQPPDLDPGLDRGLGEVCKKIGRQMDVAAGAKQILDGRKQQSARVMQGRPGSHPPRPSFRLSTTRMSQTRVTRSVRMRGGSMGWRG
jgi:hypothetical protein